MNLHRRREPQSQDNSMIPLINVVFLMLAFFMILGQIEKSDAVRLDTPESESLKTRGEPTATLLVTANQALYLDDRPLRLAGLRAEMSRLLDTSASPQDIRVLVKADAELPASELRAILGHLRAAGLLRVSLATEAAAGA